MKKGTTRKKPPPRRRRPIRELPPASPSAPGAYTKAYGG